MNVSRFPRALTLPLGNLVGERFPGPAKRKPNSKTPVCTIGRAAGPLLGRQDSALSNSPAAVDLLQRGRRRFSTCGHAQRFDSRLRVILGRLRQCPSQSLQRAQRASIGFRGSYGRHRVVRLAAAGRFDLGDRLRGARLGGATRLGSVAFMVRGGAIGWGAVRRLRIAAAVAAAGDRSRLTAPRHAAQHWAGRQADNQQRQAEIPWQQREHTHFHQRERGFGTAVFSASRAGKVKQLCLTLTICLKSRFRAGLSLLRVAPATAPSSCAARCCAG